MGSCVHLVLEGPALQIQGAWVPSDYAGDPDLASSAIAISPLL